MYLNEATLLNNIRVRYSKDKIYVSIKPHWKHTMFTFLMFRYVFHVPDQRKLFCLIQYNLLEYNDPLSCVSILTGLLYVILLNTRLLTKEINNLTIFIPSTNDVVHSNGLQQLTNENWVFNKAL